MRTRRHLLRALTAAALLHGARRAAAQAPGLIRLVVAYPPGGQSDLVARLLAPKLAALLGIPMVVENRSGAGGMVGAESVARAPADGSTLLVGSGSNLTFIPLHDSAVHYDPLRDFAPVGRIARAPLVLAVRSSLPVTNVSQLIEYARSEPGRLTCASGPLLVEFAIESLQASTGVDILLVPYKGTAPGLLDVVAGRVDLILADVAAVAPHVQSGALRVLANAGPTRSRAFSTVPTMKEQGFDFSFESWQGLLAPSGTPAEHIERLQTALAQALAAPDLREAIARMGFEPIDEPPAAFAAFLRDEVQRYRRAAERSR